MNTTSANEALGWTPAAASSPPVTRVDEQRVAAFVAAHKLEEWVEAAVRLAREAFPRAKRITLAMFGEPGEYGERLFVEVATGADVDESLRQYHDCVRRWIDATPPWVTDLMGITTDVS
jgi:hypothetical protein